MHISPLVRVIDAYAVSHHTTLADLTGPCQKWPLVHQRQEAYYLCWMDPCRPSLNAIARRFGGRDHTTIRSGIWKHCDRAGIPRPPDFRRHEHRILEDA